MTDTLAYTKDELLATMRDTLSTIAQRIRENHIAAKQVASGRTLESIRWSVTEEDGGFRGLVTGRQAFFTLEHGRNGGNVPANFPEIIREWMRDKGIKAMPIPYVRRPSEKWQPKYTPEERGEMSMAWAIATTIKTHGTYLARTGTDFNTGQTPDIYTTPVAEGLDTLNKSISALFSKTINHINDGTWQQN